MFGREKIAMIVAEFVGTFTLASVVLAMLGRTTFPFFEAIVAGLALTGLTLAFGVVSGAFFNPALAVAAWTARKLDTTRAIVFIAAEMLGGVVAWTLNQWLLDTTLKNIANTAFSWRIFTAEAVGAAVFAMVVAAAARQAYTGLRNAVTVGLGLTFGMLIASFASNGLINPAVAVGVQSWSFIYVAAPVLGALVGMNVYTYLFTDRPKRVVRVVKTAAKTAARKTTAKKTTARRK